MMRRAGADLSRLRGGGFSPPFWKLFTITRLVSLLDSSPSSPVLSLVPGRRGLGVRDARVGSPNLTSWAGACDQLLDRHSPATQAGRGGDGV
jgi:hypothetical protein